MSQNYISGGNYQSNDGSFGLKDNNGGTQKNLFSDDNSQNLENHLNNMESQNRQIQHRHGIGLTRYRIKSSQGLQSKSRGKKKIMRDTSAQSTQLYSGTGGRPYVHIDPHLTA